MQSSRIRAEVQMDGHVVVPRNRKTVTIEALALIHNDSDDHYVLGAPDAASAHSWQLLDADGKEVARQSVGRAKKVRGVTDTACGTMVPSRHSVREMETLTVEASKLQHGLRYTLRHNHWGYVGEAEFVAVHEPERAAAPKKKAAKKKAKKARKAAKSKAVKRQPAKKKVAATRKAAPKKAAPKKAAPKKTAGRKKTARKS